MGKRWLSLGVLVLTMALFTAGCSSSKKGKPGADGSLDESSVDSVGSLDSTRKGGAPGATNQGPLRDLAFGFDSYELDDEARASLREGSAWLKDNTKGRVEIEGHCDERGTVEYNLALGAKRARAAKDYLVTLGVSNDRLSTISYGEELPLCTDHSEDCWARNRRDHFVLLGD
jgi:peptidoglycan-associated lipoprotein